MTERPHILFVDDEPRILSGLRRMLRTHRDRWDMSFAENGDAALATMQAQHCDVIVTDYRMPGMNGAELLERVRTDFPGTARVILSGQTNEDNLLRILVLTHEFLNKPSTPEQIVATVERLIEVRSASSHNDMRRDVTFIESLPSAPSTLIELVEALDASDASAQSIGAVIEKDPAATAKVLHLVNSSAYTLGRTVSNVGQAVALLGMHTVRGLVLMHDLVRTFDVGGALPAGWIDDLTRHSVESSRVARMLAAGTEGESHAFAAGLLHEVGQLVMASCRPVAFRGVLDAWRHTGEPAASEAPAGVPLAVTEREAFGISHHEVGAQLLALWGLPNPVVQAVSGHGVIEQPLAAVDPPSAVVLAHLVIEADLGPVCGRCDGTPVLDEDQLDDDARGVVTRWRRERSRRS